MSMEDKKLTAQESLEVITSMISRTKERYFGNGNILLLWGFLTVAVTIAVWILLLTTQKAIWNLLWIALPVIGLPLSAIIGKKQTIKDGVRTYSDRIISKLWMITGMSYIIMVIACIIFKSVGICCWSTFLPFTLMVVPISIVAQGLIVKEGSMISGGFIALIIGIFTLCCVAADIPLGVNWFLPLFIIAFIVMMVIPGFVLNYKIKHQ